LCLGLALLAADRNQFAAKFLGRPNKGLTAGCVSFAPATEPDLKPMKRLVLALGVLVVGALMLSPAIVALDVAPLPSDLALRLGHAHIAVPLGYSLCASLGLTLLYYATKG
jgi:hypothetical protein